jgi:hypothetical protein
MILLIWLLAAYGMSNILVYGSIFAGFRDGIKKWGDTVLPFNGLAKFIGELLSCMMCTSTWVGFFFGITYYSPSTSLIGTPDWIGWFFDGLIASGFVWAFNGMVEWFEENRPTKN